MNTAERARELGIKVGDEVEVSFSGKLIDLSTAYVEVEHCGVHQTTHVSDIRLIRRAPVTCPDHKPGEQCRWMEYVKSTCQEEPCRDHRQPSASVPPTAEELADMLRVILNTEPSKYWAGARDMIARWDAVKGGQR